jgi:hypothetical protein
MASSMMKIGGVGSIILTVGLIIGIIFQFITLSVHYWEIPGWLIPLSIAIAVIAAVGLVLISIGAFGLWRQYEGSFSLVVGIMGIVTMAIAFAMSAITWVNFSQYIRGSGISLIAAIIDFVFVGVFFILFGVAFILLRGKTGHSGLSLTVGILGIIAGAFYCSILLALIPVAQILLIPTMICTAYIFFAGK